MAETEALGQPRYAGVLTAQGHVKLMLNVTQLQHRRLVEIARARNTPLARIFREAVDLYLAEVDRNGR